MFQTVWRPRRRFQALVIDRSSVDDAPPVGPVVDAQDRGLHLGEDGGIGFDQRAAPSTRTSEREPNPACAAGGPRLEVDEWEDERMERQMALATETRSDAQISL